MLCEVGILVRLRGSTPQYSAPFCALRERGLTTFLKGTAGMMLNVFHQRPVITDDDVPFFTNHGHLKVNRNRPASSAF